MLLPNNLKHPLSSKELHVVFGSNSGNETLTFKYQLYEHQLIEKWLALWKKSHFENGVVGATNFSGQIIDNEDFLVATLNALIMKINKFVTSIKRSDLIINEVVEKGVSQNILNNLHLYFEMHSYHPDLRDPLKNTFRLLNLLIHRMENFSDHKKNNCLLIEVSPAETVYLLLQDQDYHLFNNNWIWGELLLNYATIGVPTAVAFKNNTHPTPQRRFSAGIQLSFVEDNEFNEQSNLNEWLVQQKLIPNDPKNAIGYIPLGILIDPIIPNDEFSRINLLMNFKKFCKIERIEYFGPQIFVDIAKDVFTASPSEIGISL